MSELEIPSDQHCLAALNAVVCRVDSARKTQFSQTPGCRMGHSSVRLLCVEWNMVQLDSWV